MLHLSISLLTATQCKGSENRKLPVLNICTKCQRDLKTNKIIVFFSMSVSKFNMNNNAVLLGIFQQYNSDIILVVYARTAR